MKDALRVTMVATGIHGDVSSRARPRNVSVVQPVAKAVGSDLPGTNFAGAASDKVHDSHGTSIVHEEEPSLLSGGRRSSRDELPLFDTDGDNQLDVPTFLRRQAD